MNSANSGAAFYRVFLVCLLLISVPVKNFAYLVPPIYFLVQMALGNQRTFLRTIGLAGLVLSVTALSVLFDEFRGYGVNLPGIALAVITYLPILLILCESLDKQIDADLFQKILTTCAWYVILQSCLAAIQFFGSGFEPDAVAGTFGMWDFLLPRFTMGQVYFTFTLFGMLLFLLVDFSRPLVKCAICMGLLSCAIAQSGHQTVFFGIAFTVVSLLQFRRLKPILIATGLVGVLALLVGQLYPATYEHGRAWYERSLSPTDSPKRIVADQGVRILADGKNIVLGTGVGQYTSRASLITSGRLMERKIPDVLSAKSDYYLSAVDYATDTFERVGEGSAISKPYCSLVSVVVEFGLLVSILLALLFLHHFRRNLGLTRNCVPQIAAIGLSANVGILFFLLSCTVENYAEYPQAFFIPAMLYVVALSRARQAADDREVVCHAERIQETCRDDPNSFQLV